jgi:hypothetical protein
MSKGILRKYGEGNGQLGVGIGGRHTYVLKGHVETLRICPEIDPNQEIKFRNRHDDRARSQRRLSGFKSVVMRQIRLRASKSYRFGSNCSRIWR